MFEFGPQYLRSAKDVETNFVIPYLLPLLGYKKIESSDEVLLLNRRFDLRIFTAQLLPGTSGHSASCLLIVDAKNPKQHLDDSQASQLHEAMTALQVNYGLLTNAENLRIYHRTAPVITLSFTCALGEIAANSDQIRTLIGRDVLHAKLHGTQDEIAAAVESVNRAQKQASRNPLTSAKSSTIPPVQSSIRAVPAIETNEPQPASILPATPPATPTSGQQSAIAGDSAADPSIEQPSAEQPSGDQIATGRVADTAHAHPISVDAQKRGTESPKRENAPASAAPTAPAQSPRVTPRVIYERKLESMKVIAIYHNKGGVGKTTITVNLAAALRNRGYSVLLIDLDSQANSTFATGLVKFQFEEDDNLRENNVYHVLESADFGAIPDVVRSSNLFNQPEIDVVPSHISLIEGQYKLNQIRASQTRLIKKLRAVEDQYDFVLIDTPPSRDIYAQVAIIAANYLIIPSDLKPFANQGLTSVRNFIKEIDEFRESMSRPFINILGVLPSKISTNRRAFDKTFPRQKEKILQHYNFTVMDSIIFERIALSHSVNRTQPVGDIEVPDPKSIFEFVKTNNTAVQAAQEFDELAEEVLRKVT